MRSFLLGAIMVALAYTVGVDRVITTLESMSQTVRAAAKAGFEQVERERAANRVEARP